MLPSNLPSSRFAPVKCPYSAELLWRRFFCLHLNWFASSVSRPEASTWKRERQVGRARRRDADVVADQPLEEALGPGHDVTEVENLWLQDLLPAEGEQLSRAPLPYPRLSIKRRPASIFDYEYEDFEVLGYEHHPAIKAPVAV